MLDSTFPGPHAGLHWTFARDRFLDRPARHDRRLPRHAALFGARQADRTRAGAGAAAPRGADRADAAARSEEHTSELQSLMRISYAVFCLKTKKQYYNDTN